jgi:hypothetical protein
VIERDLSYGMRGTNKKFPFSTLCFLCSSVRAERKSREKRTESIKKEQRA